MVSEELLRTFTVPVTITVSVLQVVSEVIVPDTFSIEENTEIAVINSMQRVCEKSEHNFINALQLLIIISEIRILI